MCEVPEKTVGLYKLNGKGICCGCRWKSIVCHWKSNVWVKLSRLNIHLYKEIESIPRCQLHGYKLYSNTVSWKNNNIITINFEIYSISVKRIGYVLTMQWCNFCSSNSLLLLIVSPWNAMFMSTSECSHCTNQAVYIYSTSLTLVFYYIYWDDGYNY